MTLTKPEDLFLTLRSRTRPTAAEGGGERPVVVLDPFGVVPGLPPLVWDPLAGCADPLIAERRAKAFASGVSKGASEQSARFYAGECAKVLQGYFHAAALAGLDLDDVMGWVADPRTDPRAEEILRTHPYAARHWDGLLRGALFGDERTAGNTITTVQQAMSLFFQTSIRERCTPTPERPATDIEALIRANGTIYLLGREDPYASASPLMTAVTEDVLDTAKGLGETSPYGRLCPPFLATLDELPSTAPIPTLATRMANERALGISFIIAAQTWRQLVRCFGDDEARTILGLSNNLIVFGGGKDVGFYRELSDLIGQRTVMREGESRSGGWWKSEKSRNWSPHETPILQASELRRIPERQALVLSEAHPPILAHLDRCIDSRYARRRGWTTQLIEDQRAVRLQVAEARAKQSPSAQYGVSGSAPDA
ncbi:TraM recognition domain-containing protein [Nocardioides zeae]|uniref:TraM recognition domain-containing protein n=1 Tax=Nocardioides imazamoxiresistens TaxID=3231893 RepID=A0ABU3PTK2_9ACTN|nr:TraM recognition domain-containing protein [Nocardioides zeae]MDT9592221.1 TraM recognition domain-containing protein [Nocardioides zeae]